MVCVLHELVVQNVGYTIQYNQKIKECDNDVGQFDENKKGE